MIYSNLAVFTALTTIVLGAPVKSSNNNTTTTTNNNNNGVIEVPLQKFKSFGSHGSKSLSRRATYDEPLDFTGIRYFAEYTVGGQKQSAILDTGSSDTWTFSNQAWSGGYDPSKSSTYKWVNNNFQEAYGTGNTNTINGTWGSDTVSIGGAEVPNYPIGFLNQTMPNFSDNRGIFGLGPRGSETATPFYPTFAERLKDAGAIQSNSFSIYSGKNESEATLLLGGIDTAKYHGPLYTLPFDKTEIYGGDAYYVVNFGFEGTTYSNGVIDTGSPWVLLPPESAQATAKKYGASWNEAHGCYVRTTAPPSDIPGLEFTIGGVPITIPGSDLFVENKGVYQFAISNSLFELFLEIQLLGDPIVKQLFLFFDTDSKQLGFAPINYTDESHLVSIGNSIPGASPAPNQTEGGGVSSTNNWKFN